MSEDRGQTHRRRRRRATSDQAAPATREARPTPTAAPAPDARNPAAHPPISPHPAGQHPDAQHPATANPHPPHHTPPQPAPHRPVDPGFGQPADRASQAKPSRRARPSGDSSERGLHDLVGAGRSQLGVDGALRGRDVNRPSDDDLAEAEESLIVVRRNWQPSDK